jgi:hypothetical protein
LQKLLKKPALSELNLLLLLAAVQFTQIMDFMVMMPLGPQLMRQLNISAQQFGGLISSFALTAGIVIVSSSGGSALGRSWACRLENWNLFIGRIVW